MSTQPLDFEHVSYAWDDDHAAQLDPYSPIAA